MNNLNLKLHGEENLMCDLHTHLKGRSKLDLFLKHVKMKSVTHFEKSKIFMAEATIQFPVAFSCGIIQELHQHFQDRFSDLDSTANEVRLFQNPFETSVAFFPDVLQLDLIELHAKDPLKDKFKEELVAFYKFLPKEEFPSLRHFASGFLSMFDTTCMCEQTFSRMKFVKSKLRTNLSDNNLRFLLMRGTSHLKPDFPAILASKTQFHHSHH